MGFCLITSLQVPPQVPLGWALEIGAASLVLLRWRCFFSCRFAKDTSKYPQLGRQCVGTLPCSQQLPPLQLEDCYTSPRPLRSRPLRSMLGKYLVKCLRLLDRASFRRAVWPRAAQPRAFPSIQQHLPSLRQYCTRVHQYDHRSSATSRGYNEPFGSILRVKSIAPAQPETGVLKVPPPPQMSRIARSVDSLANDDKLPISQKPLASQLELSRGPPFNPRPGSQPTWEILGAGRVVKERTGL